MRLFQSVTKLFWIFSQIKKGNVADMVYHIISIKNLFYQIIFFIPLLAKMPVRCTGRNKIEMLR
jgi:hypothetical protein